MPQDFTAGQVLTAAQMDTLSGAVDGYATTATAAGTTVMTVASLYQQFFTGSTTQTVTLPVASTLYVGWKQRYVNNSSGIVTVQSSGANTIYAVPAGGDVIFTCILASGTTAASWDYKNHIATASSGMTLISTSSMTLSTITLSSIPATYKNLRVVVRNFKPVTDDNLFFRFNADATASRHGQALALSTTAIAFSSDSIRISGNTVDNTTAYGLYVMDFPDYTNTATWKMFLAQCMSNDGTTPTTANVEIRWGLYNQLGAISSMQFFTNAASATAEILLYGVS